MKEQTITIWIDEDGQIEADAEGFEGSECLEELEELLEEQPAIREVDKKPEFDAGRQTSRREQKISNKTGEGS